MIFPTKRLNGLMNGRNKGINGCSSFLKNRGFDLLLFLQQHEKCRNMKISSLGLLLLGLSISFACTQRQSGEKNGDRGDQTDTATIFKDTVKNTSADSPSRQKNEGLKTDTSRKNR